MNSWWQNAAVSSYFNLIFPFHSIQSDLYSIFVFYLRKNQIQYMLKIVYILFTLVILRYFILTEPITFISWFINVSVIPANLTKNWRKHGNLIATRPCKILQKYEHWKLDIDIFVCWILDKYDEGDVPSYLAVVVQFFISLHKS